MKMSEFGFNSGIHKIRQFLFVLDKEVTGNILSPD